jgi:hypothetical protein
VFNLLSNYFIEDPQSLKANLKIENLIKAVIMLTKLSFNPRFFIKSLDYIRLEDPPKAIRDGFKMYLPTVRSSESKKVRDLLN